MFWASVTVNSFISVDDKGVSKKTSILPWPGCLLAIDGTTSPQKQNESVWSMPVAVKGQSCCDRNMHGLVLTVCGSHQVFFPQLPPRSV